MRVGFPLGYGWDPSEIPAWKLVGIFGDLTLNHAEIGRDFRGSHSESRWDLTVIHAGMPNNPDQFPRCDSRWDLTVIHAGIHSGIHSGWDFCQD